MGKSKTKGKAAKAVESKPAAKSTGKNVVAKALPAPAAPVIPPMALVGNAQAKLAPLSAQDRTALRARPSDEACEKLGRTTRGTAVLDEASRWVPQILTQVMANPAALHYRAERLAYLCELLVELNQTIEDAAGEKTDRKGAGGTAVAGRSGARTAHVALVEKLLVVAEGDDADEAKVSDARVPNSTDSDLGRSLAKLANVADDFIARAKSDQGLAFLVAEAKLTADDSAAARNAAGTLATSTAAKTEAGSTLVRDTPAVNRVEGRVLHEVKRAFRQFQLANERDASIPKLIATGTLAKVVAHRAKDSSEDAAATPVTPAPVTPAPATK